MRDKWGVESGGRVGPDDSPLDSSMESMESMESHGGMERSGRSA